MADIKRGANGHFIKRAEGESGNPVKLDTGNAGVEQPAVSGIAESLVDPASAGRKGDGESSRRGPGRPKKDGTGTGKETQKEKLAVNPGKVDLDSLNFTLFYAHELLAKAARTPEIALDKDEARRMAESAMNVMQHYNIKASQKAIDWGNLVLTMSIIYGGKFHAISERQKHERAAKAADQQKVREPYGLA